jgi:Holliday junction resolvase RusA-like endonuclease
MSKQGRIKWEKPVRVKLIGEFGKNIPSAAKAILDYYTKLGSEKGLTDVTFTVDGTPRSLNHMYGRNAKTGAVWRKPDVDDFTYRVIEALGEKRWTFKPTGPCAAIIFLESPYWITMERQVRESDADNRIKVVMDAFEKATGLPDELNWQFHVFKVASKRARTTVYIFDLGDVVEYFF